MLEREITLAAERHFGAFTTYGFFEDDDPPTEEFIVQVQR